MTEHTPPPPPPSSSPLSTSSSHSPPSPSPPDPFARCFPSLPRNTKGGEARRGTSRNEVLRGTPNNADKGEGGMMRNVNKLVIGPTDKMRSRTTTTTTTTTTTGLTRGTNEPESNTRQDTGSFSKTTRGPEEIFGCGSPRILSDSSSSLYKPEESCKPLAHNPAALRKHTYNSRVSSFCASSFATSTTAFVPRILVVLLVVVMTQLPGALSHAATSFTTPRLSSYDSWAHEVWLEETGAFVVQWTPRERDIEFRVTARTTGYIGFGLSSKPRMAGADIVVGWVHSGKAYLQDRHGQGNREPAVDEQRDWLLVGGYENDTHTVLIMTRPYNTCDEQDHVISVCLPL